MSIRARRKLINVQPIRRSNRFNMSTNMNLLLPGDHPYPTLLKPGNGIYLDDLEHNKMIAIRVLFAGDLSKCKTFRKALITAHFFCELIVLFCMMTIPKPGRYPRLSRPARVICGCKIFFR